MITKIAEEILHEIGPLDSARAYNNIAGLVLAKPDLIKERGRALASNSGKILATAAGGALLGAGLGSISHTGIGGALPGAILGAGAGGIGAQMKYINRTDTDFLQRKGLHAHPEFLKHLLGKRMITQEARDTYLK